MLHYFMQVNKNGVISFGRNFTDLPSSKTKFPLPDAPPFIAVFWGDIELSNGVLKNLFVLEINSTHNATKLEEASSIVCDILDGRFSKRCEPQSILVAVWKCSHSKGLNMVSWLLSVYTYIYVVINSHANILQVIPAIRVYM